MSSEPELTGVRPTNGQAAIENSDQPSRPPTFDQESITINIIPSSNTNIEHQENFKKDVLVNPALADNGDLDRVTLAWKGLNVSAILKKASVFDRCKKNADNATLKPILKDVNGEVEAGTLIAIMGASGAGKTTLMNVLAHQDLSQLSIEGTLTVNGKSIGKQIKTISAYVRQEDLFIGTLTVREHLLFQAYLRMESTYSKSEKEKRVDSVMAELGLTKCKDTIIGVPGRLRGISGGEMKRLSFASEVITNPSLLFVDEPTSGLDSFMAQSVILSLKRMAASGKTILATIHQPSSEIFQMFDSLLLLSEGRVAYMGSRAGALTHFSRLGYQCPSNFNPADFYISTLAIIPGKEEESRDRSKKICDHFQSERAYNRQKSEVIVGDKIEKPDYKVGPVTQFTTLLWRCFYSNIREPYLTKINIMQAIVIGLVAGLIYLQQDNDQDSIPNINGFMFFAITTLTFNSATSSLFVFPAELPVFLKEHRMGMYRPSIYFICKTLVELPWYLICSLLLATISYWMVGLRSSAEAYFIFCALCILVTQTALSYGYVISTISPTIQVATAIGPPLILPFLLFGGFFMKDSTVPDYFAWLKYLSWFRYSFEAMAINQWDGFGSINCDASSTSRCLDSGEAVLKDLSFDAGDLGFDFGILVALMVGFRLLAFLILLIRTKRK